MAGGKRTIFDDEGQSVEDKLGSSFASIVAEKVGAGSKAPISILPTAQRRCVRELLAAKEADRERERERVRAKHKDQKRKRKEAEAEAAGRPVGGVELGRADDNDDGSDSEGGSDAAPDRSDGNRGRVATRLRRRVNWTTTRRRRTTTSRRRRPASRGSAE